MACTIVRNKETGKIDHVKAPNGERSRLFESIRIAQPNWSDEQLLREYAKYYTTEFQDKIKEAKRLDSSFNLDLDEKLRNILINLYPEIELAYTNDIIQPANTNDIFNQIMGQANIKAMTVLINAVDQKQDTLPHEYAHHYIAWYRHTPIVQEAIAKWGSEEALVQAIGEQAVKQEGEAWTWWKNFVEWILNKFAKLSDVDKETLKNALTDAFLTRTDLNTISDQISIPSDEEVSRKLSDDYGSNNEFGENLEYKLNKISNNEFYQLNEDQKSDFIEGLDNYLISFLEQFGVAVKDINEFKNRRGVNALGVTDTLNKIVYYSQNRNKYTLPEEAAHMLLFLAGLNNNIINEFIRDIQFWDGYDAVHKKYVKVYGQDIAKIKLEAAGQLLSQMLVEEYKASGISDRIIQGVKNAVNGVLDMFKNIFKVPRTADDMSGYSYNLGRKIARKILEGDVEYITKLPDNLKKLKYDNVVKPNTFVKDVIDDFTSLDPNIKISGSLALSLQGDVYRESDVTVHDLDFVVVGDDAEAKLLNHLKNKYSTITINQFDNDSYRVNQFFVTKKENTLIPAVGSDIDNMEFEGLRLADGTIVAVDNDNTLVIDIFVHPETDSTLINDKSYDSWEHIFISKQNLGSLFGKTFTGFRREKDQRDFNYFDTPKDVRYQNEDNLFYQLDENNEPIYTPDQTNTESIPEILHEIKYQHSFYHLANLGAELSNINNIPNIETFEEELLGGYTSRYDHNDKVIYIKKDLNKFDKYVGYLKSYFEASATNTLASMSSIHQEMLNNILDNAYDRLKEKGADQIPGFNKAKLLNSVFNNSYLIGLLKKTPAISEYRDLVSPNVENPSLYMQLIKVIANINGVSNNNLPVLDQILSTRADLVKENDNLAAKPDLYFNLQDQHDSPESARLGYNELMQMVIASELEDNVDLNESNYPPGTKNEDIQQIGHTEEQKQAFEKIKKESDKIKRTEVVTIEQLEQAAKGTNKKTAEKVRLLKKFVDSTARYVLVDEEGVEKIIPLRPSDLGKLVFAEKRNFNKEDITRMDSSRDSILSRGMGTTMHKVQQLFINEIDKQNEDNSLLSFQTLGDVKDFYNNNYLKVINNTNDPELKEIIDSLNKKGTYSKEYSSEELLGIVDVNVPKEDRTFTFDKTDFENLAYLAFKLYHQVYKIQFDLDANSNIKHKPIILTETKIVDEDNGIAGAIDLLVVYTTDKELKYGFYDYKFINFEREMDILQTKPDEETIKKQKITTQYRNKAGKLIELDPSALKSKDYNPYLVANKLRAKYQSFDLQITAYKDILTKGKYGILKSQIMESRVIPVNMMFRKVKDGETYKRIPTIRFLDHDHELLSQIPFANELTNDVKINEFIELLFTKRAELYKLRERKRDDERINDRITDLDYIIKTLQVKKDIKAVAQRLIQIGDAIEGAIANGKESDSIFGKMYATDEDLVFYEEMIKLYDNFSSYVTYEYDKLRKEAENSKDPNKEKTFKQIDDALAEQNFKIKSLLDKIRTVRDERLLSYADSNRVAKIQDNFDVELNINSKDLRNMGIGSTAKQYLYSDISWIQATLYGISDWDNPLAFMGKQILDNINYEVKEYTESVGKRIEEHRNALVEYAKRKGISPMAVFELFINRIGNKALFVSKLDSEFYKERAKAIDEKDLKWLKQNLVFDKEKFDKAYKKYEDRLLTKYHLKDLSGKDNITNNVKYQLKAFESKFNAEKSEFAYYTDRNYFLKANPQAEIKYESNKWKTIKANKELLDFYNFYLEMIDEIKDLTGDARINSLFVPQIHRDTADILSNNFFSFDAIKNVYTSFVESNKLRTEDEAIGLVINDQVMDDVPLRYADPINIDNLLTDLTKSLMLMSYSAKTYQMAELAKGTLEAIRMAIADTKFTERDTLGNKKQGKLVEGSVSKLYEAYSKQLKYHLYGQTLQSTKLSRMSGIETGTLGRVNPIKVLRDVMSFYSKKSLAFNMTSIVGGHFNVKSQLRQLAKKEQHFNLKTLNETEKIFASINREAHIFNEMFKISQEGNAGLIFEQANRLSVSKLRQVWNKPISYFFQRRSDDAMDAHLLYTMLKSYALHPDGKTVFPISKKNKFLKGTEWENAEIKSMWDSLVFDENATDPNAKITIKSFDGSIEMTKLQFMTFRERTRKLMSRARGNVSNEDIANYRNTLEGQVIGQFKGWVPTTLLLERFGQARYNFTLDELEIGRYRVFLGEFTKEGIMPKLGTFAKMMSAVIFFKSKNLADVEISKGYYNKWRLENPELADKVTFEEFIKTRSSQLAALAAEIRMYLLVKLALLGIAFSAGDKEEKRNPAVRTLMTWLDRVALEIGFYFDPSQTVQIVTRGPLPLLNMVNELRNLLGNSIQEIGDFMAGAEKDKKISFLTPGDEPFTINIFEEKPDKTPPFTYIFRFVPGLKGISDLLELTKDPDERPTLLEWAFGVENYKYR